MAEGQESRVPDLSVFESLPAACALLGRDRDGALVLLATNAAFEQHVDVDLAFVIDDGELSARLDGVLGLALAESQWRNIALPGYSGRLRASRMAEPAGTVVVEFAERQLFDELALRSRVDQLQDLVDNSTALMYVKDLDGRYLIVNDYFARRFGVQPSEIVGKSDHDLFPFSSADVYSEHDRDVVESGISVEVEEPFAPIGGETDGDDDRRWLSIKFPLLDASGRPYALGAISTDITDRKRAESAARIAMHEAERANQSKSEFLSRISHELRTPLNAILGFAQLLHDGSVTPSQLEGSQHILDAGRHLLSLVNDVLDITWIDAGAPGLVLSTVPAVEPLHEALQLIRPIARRDDIEIASDLHHALFRSVVGDAQRLRQVFLNLLSNAVKFNSRHGAIKVSCAVHGDRLRFLVTDTGRGIRDDERELLFTAFGRLPSSADIEGTGLGLALSRRLVEEMGGELGIEHSAVGEGTTFYVELVLAEADAVTAAPEPAQPHDDGEEITATVLHIEDTHANLRLVEHILGRYEKLELVPATSGATGIDIARRLGRELDLVLLDLNLSDMTGADVIAAFHADPVLKDTPVIVLSADATPTRIAHLRSMGIADYLTKPLDIRLFVDAVRRVLDRR
ncbi:ATP-binding protein [Herbiconiux sp. A18JL235]|uniref:histidine kinase n=1 Tax=Herbiconiux sp. A18JL235 TaxID=3152363 RepID=A0AB39BGA8_9MICO